MIIAIPAAKNSEPATVNDSFGRAPYFMVVDTETAETRFIDNSAAASQGGAGIKAAQTVADTGADALIVPRLGQNAADVLDDAQVKIYKSEGVSLEENIKALEAGKLQLLSDVHAGFHNHGGQ